jgi:adenylate cyclase
MYSSKELMDKAGVSRATLNNYIGMGLISKPIVKNPNSADDKARRLGYFPEDALERLYEINELKKRGMRMANIIEVMAKAEKKSKSKKATASAVSPEESRTPTPTMNNGTLQLTIDKLEHPAYLVNNKFEIEWSNVDSESQIFGQYGGLSSDIVDRNLFRLL